MGSEITRCPFTWHVTRPISLPEAIESVRSPARVRVRDASIDSLPTGKRIRWNKKEGNTCRGKKGKWEKKEVLYLVVVLAAFRLHEEFPRAVVPGRTRDSPADVSALHLLGTVRGSLVDLGARHSGVDTLGDTRTDRAANKVRKVALNLSVTNHPGDERPEVLA